MDDLYVGFAILTAASVVAFRAALLVARFASPLRIDVVAVGLLVLMGLYTAWLWQTPAMMRLLPYSNVIVLGNWFPPAAAFLAGLMWDRLTTARARRGVLAGSLALAASYSMVHPLLGEQPRCREAWEGNVCLQTSRSTCSAASAATLLRAAGIRATESEMADLCLTRNGTTWAGLYRGLKHKTAGTAWDVEIVRGIPADLQRFSGQPVLLSVGLPDAPDVDSEYVERGFVPGQAHSIVLFRFLTRNAAVVGDPAIGTELWSSQDFEVLWHGEGIRLVRRPWGLAMAHRHED